MEEKSTPNLETGEKLITLPSGGWAVFKDAASLRVKDRKKVFKNADNQQGIMQALSLVDGILAILIKEWSFETPIPLYKIAVLDELSMADYDTLSTAAGEAQKILFPKLAETEETKKDEDSPFGESND